MLIVDAKIISHPVISVTTDENKVYKIDFTKPHLLKNHEFDKIRENKDFFYNNFSWDKWNVWWSPYEDVSIDELDYKSYVINNV